jgi:large subunit ribosomal protein L37Ae
MTSRKAKKTLKGLRAMYGSSVRKKYTKTFKLLKQKRQCPNCGAIKIKRLSTGIWKCYSCDFTVTGGAYDVKIPQLSKS